MNALAIITDAGVQASVEPAGGLKLKGLSKLTVEQKNQIIDYARKHKPAILAALTNSSAPGECELCPAAGYWDYMRPGKWCFHTAYFLGKSGQPVHCDSAKQKCPLKSTILAV
jgi:hypothetical protein